MSPPKESSYLILKKELLGKLLLTFYLPFSALCCTDKKGVLSWPNTSAEKIFLLKRKEDESKDSDASLDNTSDSDESRSEFSNPAQVVAEILTVTHDHTNPFNVEFDDPKW